ncbi:MAG: tetratricopeptide repeat protein [Rhodospirillaceae bacterium]|nr:tetratricopeptide repeat protein [Rhodospirillaceae bacterium]
MSEGPQRKLAAIVSADVVGYSRLMGADEAGTHARLKARYQNMVAPSIAKYGGRVVKLMGDGLLAEFQSVVHATEWAVEIQDEFARANEPEPPEHRIDYRVGVNLGDVIIDQDDLYGDGVNLAARLQEAAQAGGVCVSDATYQQVNGKVQASFIDGGEVELKNIAGPVRIWRWVAGAIDTQIGQPRGETKVRLAATKPSIAVLPFENMTNDPEQAFFADGITEDLVTGLSRIRWLFVIARNSTNVYKDRAVDVRQVADELEVRYVLEGSVRKASNRVRITAQLIDAQTSNHLWAERYDRELTDIFDVQDEITERVAGAIEPAILAAEGLRSRERSIDDLGAWELLMQGVTRFWRFTDADAEEAIALLEEAISLHPEYAPAHSMLSFLLLFSGHVGWTALAESRKRAETLASRASALDDQDAWTQVSLGYLHTMKRDTHAALQAFAKALDLNPNFASAYGWRAMAEAHAGMAEEALADFDLAVRLSPKDPQNAVFLGAKALAHFMADQFDTAASIAADSIRQRPGWLSSYRMECTALARAGRLPEAETSLERLLEKQPGLTAAQLRSSLPYPDGATLEKFVGGLVLAGLPEK